MSIPVQGNNGKFSFGVNWTDFVINRLNQNIISTHINDLKNFGFENTSNTISPKIKLKDVLNNNKEWRSYVDCGKPKINIEDLKNYRVIDIGCGSGLSSLSFTKLGCKELISFDYDQESVNATKITKNKFIKFQENWNVYQDSILNDNLIDKYGTFDIVYSWGVLHHTGNLWKAINNSISLCKENGYVWLALYNDGPTYSQDLKLKITFNNSNRNDKIKILKKYISLNWPNWSPKKLLEYDSRGMNKYNDAIDWLGGYPYEVVNYSNVISYFEKHNFEVINLFIGGGRGCSTYLFKKMK